MQGIVRVGTERGILLRPFLLKLRDSYLIGLTPEPEMGSPCVHCVELWLAHRRVWSERLRIDELPIRRDLVAKLNKENHPHLLFEIAFDGTETRMDCFVYPHPACGCAREKFVGLSKFPPRLNFAFSPVNQIKCARYGIPSGNLWLTSAAGTIQNDPIRVFATGTDREESRLKAVENWMKQASVEIFQNSLMPAADLNRNAVDFVTHNESTVNLREVMRDPVCLGAGKDEDSAIQDALREFAKLRTLNKYTAQGKKPMLVVGAGNWVRSQVPFFLLQQYDLHLLFYPTSTPAWVVGVAALSRIRTSDAPIFIFESHHDVSTALTTALTRMLEHCRPVDWLTETDENEEVEADRKIRNSRLSAWWNHWIYGCPKISLKDILHLEPHGSSTDLWRQYLADGGERLKVVALNSPLLPKSLRTLVKLVHPSLRQTARSSNVNGIGTLSSFFLR